jgi:hypothetical protein
MSNPFNPTDADYAIPAEPSDPVREAARRLINAWPTGYSRTTYEAMNALREALVAPAAPIAFKPGQVDAILQEWEASNDTHNWRELVSTTLRHLNGQVWDGICGTCDGRGCPVCEPVPEPWALVIPEERFYELCEKAFGQFYGVMNSELVMKFAVLIQRETAGWQDEAAEAKTDLDAALRLLGDTRAWLELHQNLVGANSMCDQIDALFAAYESERAQ